MKNSFGDHLTSRSGIDRRTPCLSALANLARHTSRDTVLIASASTGSSHRVSADAAHLTSEDIDGLSKVVHDLGARDLDLVLHGSGAGLIAAADLISLLRGRYDSIRALVPDTALSILSLIAFACDTVIMPETAVLGVSDDPREPRITAPEAATWLARNCNQTDLLERIEFVVTTFGEEEGSRAPMTAAHAHELGFQIHLVGDRSGIGADLAALGPPIEKSFRTNTLVKLIENHRGAYYSVES
jgi:hypothetical protein